MVIHVPPLLHYEICIMQLVILNAKTSVLKTTSSSQKYWVLNSSYCTVNLTLLLILPAAVLLFTCWHINCIKFTILFKIRRGKRQCIFHLTSIPGNENNWNGHFNKQKHVLKHPQGHNLTDSSWTDSYIMQFKSVFQRLDSVSEMLVWNTLTEWSTHRFCWSRITLPYISVLQRCHYAHDLGNISQQTFSAYSDQHQIP